MESTFQRSPALDNAVFTKTLRLKDYKAETLQIYSVCKNDVKEP